MTTIYSCNGLETVRIDTHLDGYAAFSGRQVIGMGLNPDKLLEEMMEVYAPEQFEIRGVTQRVMDAIADGEDCLDIVQIEHGLFGRVFDLR